MGLDMINQILRITFNSIITQKNKGRFDMSLPSEPIWTNRD